MLPRITDKHLNNPAIARFIDKYLQTSFKSETFILPSLNDIVNFSQDLYFTYLNEYYAQWGTAKWFDEEVSTSIMVTQQSLLGGLVYGYDKTKGTLNLYTANEYLLSKYEGGLRGYKTKSILKNNSKGIIYAKRIDVNYSNLRGASTEKITNLTGNNKLVYDNFIFIPYVVINHLIQLLVGLFMRGNVLEFKVQEGNAIKTRYSTVNSELIAKFGSSLVVESQPIIDLRNEGKIYIPVLGAPITTMGLTSVRFQNIESLKVLDNNSIQSLPITPANNSIDYLIRNEIISIFISKVFELADEKENKRPLYTLFKIFTDLQVPGIKFTSSRLEYIKSLRYLTEEEIERLWFAIPANYRAYEGTAKRMITGFKQEYRLPNSSEELENMLNKGLYRIIYLKPDGRFAVCYGTNNLSILNIAYGNKFLSRKESLEDRKIYLKTSLDSVDYKVTDAEMRSMLGFFGLNRAFPRSMSYQDIVELIKSSSLPVLGEGELNTKASNSLVSIEEELNFDGTVTPSFTYSEDSQAQGTADRRIKVRCLFHTKGSIFPMTRKIDYMSIYSMARLDV